MEYKKKTIIWEDNNEPPKDYIGAKKDGKFYEYSYSQRNWIESTSISSGSNSDSGSGNGSGSGSGSGGGGGDSTPTEFYLKFKWKDFGGDDVNSYIPDKTRGYALDEIFDMSDDSLQRYINEREKSIQEFYEISQDASGDDWGAIWKYNGNYNTNSSTKPYHYSLESGTVDGWDNGRGNGTYPIIELGFISNDGPETFIVIIGSNLMGYSMSVPYTQFKKNPEDGKWYIINYGIR